MIAEALSSTMKSYHVYGLGAALVDTEIDVTDADLSNMRIEKGIMTSLDEARRIYLLNSLSDRLVKSKRTSGGSTANALITISQFGGKTFYSCKVGSDGNGQFYLNDLRAASVDCHVAKSRVEGLTGTCVVMITPDAERTLNSYLGVSEIFSQDDLVPEAIIASKYLYFEAYLAMSSSMRVAAIRGREIAEANGVKTAMSFSDPGIVMEFRNDLREMLGDCVDLLFCNRCEALTWAQTDKLDIAIDSLKKIARTFVITLGEEGALAYDGTHLHTIAPD